MAGLAARLVARNIGAPVPHHSLVCVSSNFERAAGPGTNNTSKCDPDEYTRHTVHVETLGCHDCVNSWYLWSRRCPTIYKVKLHKQAATRASAMPAHCASATFWPSATVMWRTYASNFGVWLDSGEQVWSQRSAATGRPCTNRSAADGACICWRNIFRRWAPAFSCSARPSGIFPALCFRARAIAMNKQSPFGGT
jgi:hypothetical protein